MLQASGDIPFIVDLKWNQFHPVGFQQASGFVDERGGFRRVVEGADMLEVGHRVRIMASCRSTGTSRRIPVMFGVVSPYFDGSRTME